MTELAALPLRDDLRSRSPYGAPQRRVPIALNVNENTHPLPDEVARHIASELAAAVPRLNRYPDREASGLRAALARYLGHGLSVEQLWAANGSNEVLQQILQAFGGPGRSALGFAPTYSMYPLLASGTGTRWVSGPRDARFELSAETAVAAVTAERPDVVILCAPNNPTGTPLDTEVVARVYDAAPGIVVVDEAYAEFSRERPSAIGLLPGRERLVVSRTMSKAFAFAGARVGYLAADPAVVDALRLVRLPYHLSVLTQAAASAALAHADTMLGTVEDIVRQRERIERELRALGFDPLPSGSNFVLFGGVADPAGLFDALADRGVLVRDVGIPHHLRVSAGTEEETGVFLAALADAVADGHAPLAPGEAGAAAAPARARAGAA